MALARKIYLLGICTLLSVACSTTPKESAKGRTVKFIKSPFAETCVQLGKFKYDGTPFIHDKELIVIMKEMAAKLKGNAVRADIFLPGVTGVSNAKGRGTAYRCTKKQLDKYLSENSEKVEITKPEKVEQFEKAEKNRTDLPEVVAPDKPSPEE